MPLLVKVVFSERALIRVSEVIAFAVKTFEQMRARFALLSLESRELILLLALQHHAKFR